VVITAPRVVGRALSLEVAAMSEVFRSADGTWFTASLLEGRVGLRLAGDADVLSVRVLREAIAALPAGLREVHLQLSGLDAIDVSAVRELNAITRQPSRPRVILHHPPAVLLRLIRLMWTGSESQFLLAEKVPDYLFRADVA
jgi:STAS domain-containing protein